MDNNIEVIEIIMQQKIANYIKKHRNLEKTKLTKNINEMLNEKEKMYYLNDEELKKELKYMESKNE